MLIAIWSDLAKAEPVVRGAFPTPRKCRNSEMSFVFQELPKHLIQKVRVAIGQGLDFPS